MPVLAINNIAVFCGSNFGALDDYALGAHRLGSALGKERITTIYGGTKRGLMGIVADTALAAGGLVHGIVTENLHQLGHSHEGLTYREITANLHRRKERMVELADAFAVLPGGIGTLEELMEVWSMNQLSEIDKPIAILNVGGFFTPFLHFIDHMVEMKMLPATHRQSIIVETDVQTMIEKLRIYRRVDTPKWIQESNTDENEKS